MGGNVSERKEEWINYLLLQNKLLQNSHLLFHPVPADQDQERLSSEKVAAGAAVSSRIPSSLTWLLARGFSSSPGGWELLSCLADGLREREEEREAAGFL